MAIEPAYEVIVVGGSYAGLSAALQLARARRRVLVIDGGIRRNRFAPTSHGFLGQDGRAPGDIVADGRAQLLAYPNVHWHDGEVQDALRDSEGFIVSCGDGFRASGARLILATGVRDELPAVDGLAERWGRSVFHCPYCHGYELHEGRIGVIAVGALSMHHALMLPDWGRVTFFVNGSFEPDDAQRAALTARGVSLEGRGIACVSEVATVVLADGSRCVLDGLFVASRLRMASALAEWLGCDFDEGPLGRTIRTDATKRTTVRGVLACGDAARMAGSIALAVGDGTMAGVSAHQSLMFGW
ncbi:NAD(P)/FAD-dependent oxidoreductase [Solimonas flava]|uniref:NAD(P)/FAD-dependent oxidoreductase n=1 Tax=Solimonas flava TaxID=415849 RepID=UPI0004189BD4|nr:NAD(P)/FAD-dependent oxidoreductase [Solimonas flava]